MKEETTGIKPLTFKSIYETDFWVKCYITVLESNKYTNAPSSIADIAILELREREEPAYMVGVLKQEISKEET